MRIPKLLFVIVMLTSSRALADSVAYTSSADFLAALGSAPTLVENYAAFTNKEDIAPGSTFDGITYTAFHLTAGTNGIISNQFNSFSGLSFGANQSNDAAEFFFDGDSFNISFAPTNAIGLFFNVNLGSGTFGLTTPGGDASTGSGSYDTSTFVFAGLISTTPFTSATISSSSGGAGTASYSIPEIILNQVPEPSTTALLMGAGAIALGCRRRRRKA